MTGTQTSSMAVADLFAYTIQNLLNACPLSSELPNHFVLRPTFKGVKCRPKGMEARMAYKKIK